MKQIDLSKITLVPFAERYSKVKGKSVFKDLKTRGVAEFVTSLPDVLSARDLKKLIEAMLIARRKEKPILWMFGAHLIKVGLSPLLSEILNEGFAQQVSTNNAGLIHDLELAFFGETSEDVESGLLCGRFGMTEETADLYQQVTKIACSEKIGLGEAAGRLINKKRARYRVTSVLATAERLQIPATIHVAIGTDVVNAHPGFDAAVVGAASQIDFKIFCQNVLELKNGGVVLNFGSAVIMPEVFLKALAIARNLDGKFSKFTSANFDMHSLYRPRNNIVFRPRLIGATSYDFAGHHEIMLPLLWAAIKGRAK